MAREDDGHGRPAFKWKSAFFCTVKIVAFDGSRRKNQVRKGRFRDRCQGFQPHQAGGCAKRMCFCGRVRRPPLEKGGGRRGRRLEQRRTLHGRHSGAIAGTPAWSQFLLGGSRCVGCRHAPPVRDETRCAGLARPMAAVGAGEGDGQAILSSSGPWRPHPSVE